jgi:hypothetical protein
MENRVSGKKAVLKETQGNDPEFGTYVFSVFWSGFFLQLPASGQNPHKIL